MTGVFEFVNFLFGPVHNNRFYTFPGEEGRVTAGMHLQDRSILSWGGSFVGIAICFAPI